MSGKSSTTVSGGIGFFGLLQVVFIVLKLLGVIRWSWLWVFVPLWIDIVGIVVILAVFFIIAYFVSK